MKFIVYCEDIANGTELRASTRPAHLEHLQSQSVEVLLAGPMLSDDGASPVGSLLIIEAESLADAKAFATADPYNKAGLFQQVSVRPYKQVIPA